MLTHLSRAIVFPTLQIPLEFPSSLLQAKKCLNFNALNIFQLALLLHKFGLCDEIYFKLYNSYKFLLG